MNADGVIFGLLVTQIFMFGVKVGNNSLPWLATLIPTMVFLAVLAVVAVLVITSELFGRFK